MSKDLKAFQVDVNGKLLDYRLGHVLDLENIKKYFEKTYSVRKLWSGGRHVLGILAKGEQQLFLKLATTEGIGEVTKIEHTWNEQFNKLLPRQTSDFWVPTNYASGTYDNLFFLITDYLEGSFFASKPEKTEISEDFSHTITKIIDFSERIQKLELPILSKREKKDYQKLFLDKTTAWHNDIPEGIASKHNLTQLLQIVKDGTSSLQKRPRHGDFTPWHLMHLPSGKLGLLDGEHAMANGVEYYDIGYFIQRIYCVLQSKELAKHIMEEVAKRGYHLEKLRIILSARAIGGFLDESLSASPNYNIHEDFMNWILNLH